MGNSLLNRHTYRGPVVHMFLIIPQKDGYSLSVYKSMSSSD